MIYVIWIDDIQNMDRWYIEYGQMVYGIYIDDILEYGQMIYGIWIDDIWNLDR